MPVKNALGNVVDGRTKHNTLQETSDGYGHFIGRGYAFLRGGLLELLEYVDLRDAEIDTAPAGALGAMEPIWFSRK